MKIKPQLLLLVCLICSILSFCFTLAKVILNKQANVVSIIVLSLDILLFTCSIYGYYQEMESRVEK